MAVFAGVIGGVAVLLIATAAALAVFHRKRLRNYLGKHESSNSAVLPTHNMIARTSSQDAGLPIHGTTLFAALCPLPWQ